MSSPEPLLSTLRADSEEHSDLPPRRSGLAEFIDRGLYFLASVFLRSARCDKAEGKIKHRVMELYRFRNSVVSRIEQPSQFAGCRRLGRVQLINDANKVDEGRRSAHGLRLSSHRPLP